MRGKVDQPLNETVVSYFGKLDSVCNELVNRIRTIRNRQDEVCFIDTNERDKLVETVERHKLSQIGRLSIEDRNAKRESSYA